jgi:hypothetical protein
VVLSKGDWSRGSKHAAVGKNQHEDKKEVHGHALKCMTLKPQALLKYWLILSSTV